MRIPILVAICLMLASCGQRKKNTAPEDRPVPQEYIRKGGEIVAATQTELLKNVTSAMKTGGTVYAIEFCNLQAMELKDSLSRLNNCEIRRIASKYRNPEDMPRTETEKEQLIRFQEETDRGIPPEPGAFMFDDRVEYYHPIVMKSGACLLCHGDPDTQIAPETLATIKELYPGDLATGFSLQDFRGAWKITFYGK